MIEFKVNGQKTQIDVDPDMPLLWVLRDELGYTGTKYGCGISLCGACTVHIDDQPVRACGIAVMSVVGKSITTIEGVCSKAVGKIVQRTWIQLDVAQCGYCQPGQMMSATALLSSNPNPTDAQIDQAMSGNICRCGTYSKIREAIHTAAQALRDRGVER